MLAYKAVTPRSIFALYVLSLKRVLLGEGDTIRTETNHSDIAARVRELLSKPATGNAWQGDISQ